MGAPRSRLPLLFLTVFIDLLGFGMVIPILPLYAREFGTGEVMNGFLIGIYSFMQLLAAPLLGRLSDRVGRRPVLMASLLGTALGFFLLGSAGSLLMLFVARMVDGITGGTVITAQAYIADVTPREDRAKAMGLIGVAFGLGFVFGPAIGGVMSHFSVEAPFYFAGAMALLNTVLVYVRLPESLPPEARAPVDPSQEGVRAVFRHSRQLPRLLLSYFLVVTGFSIMTTNFALFTLARFGYDEAKNGYLFAFIGVISVIVQGGILRRMLRRQSERRVALVGAVFLTAGLALLPVSATLAMLLVMLAVIGTGNSLLTPTLTGLSSRMAAARWQGRVMGLMQAAASLARCIGPWVGGVLLSVDVGNRAGYGQTPFWAGAALIVLAFFGIAALPDRPEAGGGAAEPHQAMSGGSGS